MKNGFRQCMAWLHTWTGLVVGWVLFFVFVTGTASYAMQEITRWMQPEQPLRAVTSKGAAEQFQLAYDKLLSHAGSQQAASWTANLANDGRNTSQLTASWSQAAAPGERRGRTESITLDAETSEELAPAERPRQTAGGRALQRMHYSLHYIPYDWAIRIVGICTMLMFVAIIAGVITHKKIFQDFFAFRPAKGQRSWLDAHNVISVLALPFYIMITYSGLMFFMYAYMPLGVPLTYGFDADSEQTYYRDLGEATGSGRVMGRARSGGGGGGGGAPVAATSAATMDAADAETEAGSGAARGQGCAQGGERGEGAERGQGGERQRRSAAMAGIGEQARGFADLAVMVRAAEQEWGHGQVCSVSITPARNAREPAKVQIARAQSQTVRRTCGGNNLEYDAVSGERLPASIGTESPVPEVFGSSMLGLHEGQYAGPLMRWLYLFSGILGASMIATGLVLWTVKRRPKQLKSGKFSFGHTLVEKLNVATVAGLPFALAVYFWSNRLLPVGLAQRANWEVDCLFIAWLLTFVYALARPVMRGWLELLALTAAAWLLLPLLNALTTQRHLLVTIPHGEWVLASVDLVFIGLGLMFAWACCKVRLKMRAGGGKLVKAGTPKKTSAEAELPAVAVAATAVEPSHNPAGA